MPTQFEKFAHPDNAEAVEPSDDTDLTNQGVLYVGGAGNVAVITAGGDTVTFSNVAEGSFIPINVSRVLEDGTTATNILVLY